VADVHDSPVMGRGEIARRLGVTPARAGTITRRKGFPAATRLTIGRVWLAADVEAWIREHWS
jgi:prophage regulatory protein